MSHSLTHFQSPKSVGGAGGGVKTKAILLGYTRFYILKKRFIKGGFFCCVSAGGSPTDGCRLHSLRQSLKYLKGLLRKAFCLSRMHPSPPPQLHRCEQLNGVDSLSSMLKSAALSSHLRFVGGFIVTKHLSKHL